MPLETNKVQLLRNAMQAYAWRSQAIASNLANLDTPGYKRVAVSFEDALQEVQHTVPSSRTIYDVQPHMRVEQETPVLEDEMMELADTQMRNQVSIRALREHFGMMRNAITGRSG